MDAMEQKWCWNNRFDSVHSVANRAGKMVHEGLTLRHARMTACALADKHQQPYYYGPASEGFAEFERVNPQIDAEAKR